MVEPDNIVIQHLRAIREQLDTLNERVLELMQRMGRLGVQVANLSVRVDASTFVLIASNGGSD